MAHLGYMSGLSGREDGSVEGPGWLLPTTTSPLVDTYYIHLWRAMGAASLVSGSGQCSVQVCLSDAFRGNGWVCGTLSVVDDPVVDAVLDEFDQALGKATAQNKAHLIRDGWREV